MTERTRYIQENYALFHPVDQFGKGEGHRDEGVSLVARGDTLLSRLVAYPRFAGINRSFIDRLRSIADTASPLGSLVISRKPTQEQLRNWLTGRGVYHEQIPMEGIDDGVIVYTKGIGSAHNYVEGYNPNFPGFPDRQETLFYERRPDTPLPGVTGALNVPSALLEFVNASFICAETTRIEQWQTLDQAIDAGVTLPLIVMHFDYVSTYLQDMLAQRKRDARTAFEQRATANEANAKGFGTVSMLTPAKERVWTMEREYTTEQRRELITNVSRAAHVARNVRRLLDMGYVYTEDSAHGGNIYAEGLMAQSDSLDLRHLGDVTDKKTREFLLFSELNRPDSLLTPYFAPEPRKNPNHSIDWETIVDVQNAYWNTLLEGKVAPASIDTIVRLMPFMRNEITLAIAQELIAQGDTKSWGEIAAIKKDVLTTFEGYDLNTMVEQQMERSAPTEIVRDFSMGGERKESQISAVRAFLRLGDITALQTDPYIAKILRLSEAIEGIEDHGLRDEILYACGEYLGKTDFTSFAYAPDIITSFDGAHLDKMTAMIMQGDAYGAQYVMKTLRIADHKQYGGSVDFGGTLEENNFLFARKLLDDEETPEELFTYANYATMLTAFSETTVLSEETKAVFRAAVHRFVEDEDMLLQVSSILLAYYSLLEEKLSYRFKAEYLREGADVLESFYSYLEQNFPLLATGHDIFMTEFFSDIDEQRAAGYAQRVSSQFSQFEIPTSEGSSSAVEKKKAIAQRYRELGYPLAAVRFWKESGGETRNFWE